MSEFRLYVLGNFRLERDGIELRLPVQKSKALLAYLALHPEAHAREKLAALFWGDSTDHDARKSLRVAFQHLYKALGKDFFDGDYETVQLVPDARLWVDAVWLSHLANRPTSDDEISLLDLKTAVGEYRGELLAGFYDDWILEAREQCKSQYIELLLNLVVRTRAASEYADAVNWAQKILQTDRANEVAHQHLIFLYAAQGDRTAALKQFEECATALRDELGVEPSAETIALVKKIQEQQTGAPSDAARLTNLPKPLTSFIGRARELQELAALTKRGRLTTLTGAGGSGKTRLAIQLGAELLPQYRDGTWWVELAALDAPQHVESAVARAFGVKPIPGESLRVTMTNELRAKELLLILDNCEHLVDTCAQLAHDLLRECPRLEILATSREALNIDGETVWQVPTMNVPTLSDITATLMEFEAVRLFVERARAVNTRFELTLDNALIVAQICRRLDGIPLALELAAARVKTLSIEQIAARLDQRFQLLTGGSRVALPRQQTLRALIDWSYDLLSDSERALFRRLAVFSGGWTLEDLEGVIDGKREGDASSASPSLDLLAHLVDKSLVLIEDTGSEPRYRFLETIREYARERLSEQDEIEPYSAKHLDYFVSFGEKAEPELTGQHQALWFRRIEAEHDNMRAALAWALPHGRANEMQQLAASLWRFWWVRGYLAEGRQWLDAALGLSILEPSSLTRTQLKALNAAGVMAFYQGEYARANTLWETAVRGAEAIGDRSLQGRLSSNLGLVARQSGDYPRAISFQEASLAISRELGEHMAVARTLNSLSGVLIEQGEYARARVYLEESVGIRREAGDVGGTAITLLNLGDVSYFEGNYPEAFRFVREGLLLAQQIQDRLTMTSALYSFGTFLVRLTNYADGLCLVGAARAECERLQVPISRIAQAEFEQLIEQTQANLGAPAIGALGRGRALTVEQAVESSLALADRYSAK